MNTEKQQINKFRAWDGKKMHEGIVPWHWDFVISLRWHKCEKSTGNGILGSGGDTAEMLVPAIRYKEVMQYTCLNDFNRKEIYQGDILSKKWKVEVYKDINTGAFMVRFHVNSTANKPRTLYKYLKDRERAGCADTDCVLVGNIYENPELLKND